FAADGEFKRRLIKVFGEKSIIDLKTGPLSLPRQSNASLTGSSAFGYNGFFMGARREYVESLAFYHDNTESLYYHFPQANRPFPVPTPMLTNREARAVQDRNFDIVIATDFRTEGDQLSEIIQVIKQLKQKHKRIGLIQINTFDL